MRVNLDRVLPHVGPLLRPFTDRRRAIRCDYFEALPPAPGRVLFLGDSITEWALWEGLFPHMATANRGISGDAVCHVLERLDSAIDDPLVISLMIGTNDLHGNGHSREPAAIAEQTGQLLDELRRRAPDAPILLNSVLPRSTHFAQRIRDLNRRYEQLAETRGITYIDLWPTMATAHGALRTECTPDGIHLTGAGYAAWVEILRPHLERAVARSEPN